MQLNKASNWNHLKAVIAASDNCAKFDQISVCSLHRSSYVIDGITSLRLYHSAKVKLVFWIMGSTLVTWSLAYGLLCFLLEPFPSWKYVWVRKTSWQHSCAKVKFGSKDPHNRHEFSESILFDGCSQSITPTRTWILYSLAAVVLPQSKNLLDLNNSWFPVRIFATTCTVCENDILSINTIFP